MIVCNKCGQKITSGSTYCSYCGALVAPDADKESADLNKEQKDDCIRPYMPKKHCADCKKELPGSTISDLCALCTIRRRNRELEEQRKNDNPSSSQRDRYDISDQFDQSVFQQDRGKYYREETADRFAPQTTGRTHNRYPNPNETVIKKQKGCLTLLMIIGVASLVLVTVGIIGFGDYSGQSTYETAAMSDELDYDGTDPSMDLPSGEQDDLTMLQEQMIQPLAEEELNAVVKTDSIAHDSDAFQADGAHIYTYGTVDYYVEDELVSSDFELCLMVSESYYLPLYLRIGEEVFYDRRNEVDSNGLITEEGAANFDSTAGSPVFVDEEPFILN